MKKSTVNSSVFSGQSQEHLVTQGMKADQATSLIEVASSRCSTVKYDVELAEEYIARQVGCGIETRRCHYRGKQNKTQSGFNFM